MARGHAVRYAYCRPTQCDLRGLGQPVTDRAIVRRPDAGQAAGGVVQIVGLISFAIGNFVEQATGAVASIQVPPLEVMVKRSPSPLNF